MIKSSLEYLFGSHPIGPLNKGVDANSIVLLSSQNPWSLSSGLMRGDIDTSMTRDLTCSGIDL